MICYILIYILYTGLPAMVLSTCTGYHAHLLITYHWLTVIAANVNVVITIGVVE